MEEKYGPLLRARLALHEDPSRSTSSWLASRLPTCLPSSGGSPL